MPMPGAPRSLNFAKQRRPSSQYGPTLVDIGQPNTHFSRQAYTGDSTSPHTSSRRLLNTEHRVDRRAALVRVSASVLKAPSPAVQLAHRSMIAIVMGVCAVPRLPAAAEGRAGYLRPGAGLAIAQTTYWGLSTGDV